MTRFISDELPLEEDTQIDIIADIHAAFMGVEVPTDEPEAFLSHLPQLDADDLAMMEGDAETDVEAEPEVIEAAAPIRKARKPKNYVNNADLMIEVGLSRAQDQMTDNFVKMLTMLCDRYATRPQYNRYSYLDDMKAYAMYMLVRTWRAFNPEKGSNPFAFYTQCVKNSFIQYLNKESDERDLRDQLLLEAGLNPSFGYGEGDDDSYD